MTFSPRISSSFISSLAVGLGLTVCGISGSSSFISSLAVGLGLTASLALKLKNSERPLKTIGRTKQT